jgi:hypothetical protein
MNAQLRIGMLAVVIIATFGVGFAQDDPDDSMPARVNEFETIVHGI